MADSLVPLLKAPSYQTLSMPKDFVILNKRHPFIYCESTDTNDDCIIIPTDDTIYQYNIKSDNYTKITDIPSKFVGTHIMHFLYNPQKQYLYRLSDDYNMLIYSLTKNKWIGRFESNIYYYPTSMAIYAPMPFNYVYLIYPGTDSGLMEGYRFDFKAKQFVQCHSFSDLSIKYQSQYVVVTCLIWMESMNKLLLLYQENSGSECIDIYEMINDKWSKMMVIPHRAQAEHGQNQRYYDQWNRCFVVCPFGAYIMMYIPGESTLYFVDIKSKEVYKNEDYLPFDIGYMILTNDDMVHLFGGQSDINQHIRVHLLDMIPYKMKDKLFEIHTILIPGYIKQIETIYDLLFPQNLQQLIISYTPLIHA